LLFCLSDTSNFMCRCSQMTLSTCLYPRGGARPGVHHGCGMLDDAKSAQLELNLEPGDLKICQLQLGPAAPTPILRPAQWWSGCNLQFLVRAIHEPEKYRCGGDLVIRRRRCHVAFWNFVQNIQARGTRRHCFRGIRSNASFSFGLDFDLQNRIKWISFVLCDLRKADGMCLCQEMIFVWERARPFDLA
jgi:hypothetical protein